MRKALIISHDCTIVAPLEMDLNARGAQTLLARDMDQALTLVGSCALDLVVLDPGELPVEEACRKLRAHQAFEKAFLLLLAKDAHLDGLAATPDGRPDDVLRAPLHPVETGLRLGAVMGRLQLAEDLSRKSRELEEARKSQGEELAVREFISITDSGTGLFTTEALNKLLPVFLIKVGNRGEEGVVHRYLCLFMIQVDRLPELLASVPSLEADEILRIVLGRMLSKARSGSLFFRHGVDRIVAVTPGVGPRSIREYGISFMRSVVSFPFKMVDGILLHVTVSMGGTLLSEANKPGLDGSLHQAEEALRRAQAEGGDRLRLYPFAVEENDGNPRH